MAYQALLAEVLAVVSADDQQGVVESATCAQLVQEGAYKLVLGGNLRVIHTVEGDFILFVHTACEGGVPAKDVAIEVAQVALGRFVAQHMRSEALGEMLCRMIGHMHAHQVDKAEHWLISGYPVTLDEEAGRVVK